MASFAESINRLKSELQTTGSDEYIENTEIKKITDHTRISDTILHKTEEFNFGKTGWDAFDEEFNNLKKTWMDLYENDKIISFSLIFKTTDSDFTIPINYVYKMYNFMKKIKNLNSKNPLKYGKLQQSLVVIKSGNIRFLLGMLFKLISPLSDVYIVSDDALCDKIKPYIINNIAVDMKIEGVTLINAKTSRFN